MFSNLAGVARAFVLALLATYMGATAARTIEPEHKTSVTTDISDIWWNQAESGWGLQLVQEHDIAFATVFIYGPDGKPTWVTAQLTVGSGLTFSGPLFVTTGPYFGGTFNPGAVTIRPAGTMTFTLLTVGTARVTYTVDGVAVTKQLQRQTLKAENYNGGYYVAANINQSSCINPAWNGIYTNALEVTVSHTATAMSMVWVFGPGDVCTYSGTYSQSGKMGTFNGPYACTTGEVGTMMFFEMTNRIGMLSGRLQGNSTNAGCIYTGRFTGLNPNKP
jgi:hypothetical protein